MATSGEAATPVDARHCPRCGKPNDCAPAASGSFDTPCWCATVSVDARVLAALPADCRGRACLCARCASGASPTG